MQRTTTRAMRVPPTYVVMTDADHAARAATWKPASKKDEAIARGANDPDVVARFNSKWRLDPATGCHEWLGYKPTNGYGRFNIRFEGLNRPVWVHRMAFFIAHRWLPVRPELELDHECENRGCCAPDHLRAVPHRFNLLRGSSPSAVHARITHCPAGHPYDETNTRITVKNVRMCRECDRLWKAAKQVDDPEYRERQRLRAAATNARLRTEAQMLGVSVGSWRTTPVAQRREILAAHRQSNTAA